MRNFEEFRVSQYQNLLSTKYTSVSNIIDFIFSITFFQIWNGIIASVSYAPREFHQFLILINDSSCHLIGNDHHHKIHAFEKWESRNSILWRVLWRRFSLK